ncbi:MAG TPA: CHAT domain-containing tetratricopeptide repeat protein [Acidobacteriota bacterium]|nr:CHAT domain-containing tetratricopeptide repeat protein [Acidobacteriota bacterium]
MACRLWTGLAACAALWGLLGAQPAEDPDAVIGHATDLLRAGDLQESRRVLEDWLQNLPQSGLEAHKSAALNRLSLIAANQGRYFEAVRTAEQAAEWSESVDDQQGLGVSFNNLGRAQLLLGRYGPARQSFLRALEIAQESGDLVRRVRRLNNVANTYFFEARYQEALSSYQQALDIVTDEPLPPPGLLRLCWVNMAVLYQKLGQYERALDLYRRLADLPLSAAPSQQAQILSNQGTLYRRLGDAVLAQEAYRKSLQLFQQAGDLDGELGVLKNLGILQALTLNDLDSARQTFQQVAQRARQASNRREEAQARLYLGETLSRMSLDQDARSQFTSALELSRRSGLSEESWKALLGLGRLSDDRRQRERRLQEALSIVESVRSRLGGSSLRAEFLADKKALYDELVALALEQAEAGRLIAAGDPAEAVLQEALSLMERSRARNFQDQLGEALEQRREQSDSRTAGRLKELASRIESLNSQLLRAQGADSQRIEAELIQRESEYAALEAELARDDVSKPDRRPSEKPEEEEPDWSGSKGLRSEAAPVVTFSRLRRELPPQSLLLTFWMGRGRLVTLALTRQHSTFSVQPWNEAESLLLENCRQALSNPQAGNWRSICRPLAAQLLDGVLRIHPLPPRLLVVPDGALALLPLEALPAADDQPLISRSAVSYLPAASLMVRPGTVPSPAFWPWSCSLAAFGDPVTGETSGTARGDSADGQSSGEFWPALPYSAAELRLIEDTVSGRTRLYLGPQAEKEHLKDPSLRRYPLLHLSTHAAIDTDYPQRSRILFSPSSQQPSQPQYLFLGEVLQLDLSGTDLVTLSACDTARGRQLRGEGLLDFSRAFLIAGARSTVAGLWKVSDRATAALMPRFYAGLMEGESKAQALRQAKLSLMASQQTYAHPFYWSAFILNGNGFTRAPLPYRWSTLLLWAALPLLALSLWGLVRFRRS